MPLGNATFTSRTRIRHFINGANTETLNIFCDLNIALSVNPITNEPHQIPLGPSTVFVSELRMSNMVVMGRPRSCLIMEPLGLWGLCEWID